MLEPSRNGSRIVGVDRGDDGVGGYRITRSAERIPVVVGRLHGRVRVDRDDDRGDAEGRIGLSGGDQRVGGFAHVRAFSSA